VPRSSVSLLLGFSAMLRVSLVSRVTARSLHGNMLGCLSHLVSGHEISRLQHCPSCIMLLTLTYYAPDIVCNLYLIDVGPDLPSEDLCPDNILQQGSPFCRPTVSVSSLNGSQSTDFM